VCQESGSGSVKGGAVNDALWPRAVVLSFLQCSGTVICMTRLPLKNLLPLILKVLH